eukprot:6461762-Amphidinium_carterae.3
MVYTRMRNHDLMFAEKVALDMSETGDFGFLDVMPRYFKMKVVLGMDGEYMNYVAPARLVALPSLGQVGAKRSSLRRVRVLSQQPKPPKQVAKETHIRGNGRAPVVVPDALTGGVPTKKDGAAICFGYNMGKCPYKVEPGHRCNRGYSVCCALGCVGKHPFPQHGK